MSFGRVKPEELPAIGAIARISTNIRAGGKPPVAGLVHAVTILLVMLVALRLVRCRRFPQCRS